MPACYHFIPADKSKLFDRIPTLGADCIVFDLEDAVAAEAKEKAVRGLSEWLGPQTGPESYYVRLNGHQSDWAEQERELLAACPWLSVVLPKLSTPDELEQSVEYYGLTGRKVIGLIEDAAALLEMEAILQTKRLSAIGLGLEDFLADSIYTAAQVADLVQHIRVQLALAAMAHGIEAIDTISLDYSEEAEALRLDCENARSAGMSGKFSIHPRQIETIHHSFAPDADLVEKAKANRQWLETAPSSASGYFKKDGVVFSPPKIKKMKKVLEWLQR